MSNEQLRARAQIIRRLDLLQIKTEGLKERCEQFDLSSAGTREELIERLYREIWKHKYD